MKTIKDKISKNHDLLMQKMNSLLTDFDLADEVEIAEIKFRAKPTQENCQKVKVCRMIKDSKGRQVYKCGYELVCD